MKLNALMNEYGVDLADIRWYLSIKTAERLLTYNEDMTGLARLIWSGRLEADLYDMEETFLEELQERLDRDFVDEPKVRELFSEVIAAKSKR